MSRSAFQFVVVIGVALLFAMLDIGPRAAAAYIPTPGLASLEPVHLDDISSSEWDEDTNLAKKLGQPLDYSFKKWPADLHRSSSTSTTTTSTGGSDYSPAGVTSDVELSVVAMVSYIRTSPVQIELSKFIDSILDPPRA